MICNSAQYTYNINVFISTFMLNKWGVFCENMTKYDFDILPL
jgi:hypothetical protein